MRMKWAKSGFLGCLSLAVPFFACAAPVYVSLDGAPTITTFTSFSINLDTQAFSIGGDPSAYTFTFYTNGAGSPYLIIGTNSQDATFSTPNFNSVGLLGSGVTVDSSLPVNFGGGFYQYAYFNPVPAAGSYFLGFQTAADLDHNPLTTGVSYGFFEIEVGSLTVVGYGFESTPGVGIATTAVPEPVTVGLVFAVVGGFVARRRYSSLRRQS